MLDKRTLENLELYEAAIEALSANPKKISPKWFYDEAGSALFEEITKLPEYYPTRVETSILRDRASELATLLKPNSVLVELGSGASVKTRILLDAMPGLETYAPLDISAHFLAQTAHDLAKDYPRLNVRPITADFMMQINLPASIADAPKVLFFPGSTIGNLDHAQARQLLSQLRAWHNVDAFVLGVDLVKNTQILIDAYDDSAGVTAAFNKNLLTRLNREALADFDLDAFEHQSRWNADLNRIEMHLVSTIDQDVLIGSKSFYFAQGESLHTESSHKFTQDTLRQLASDSGWALDDLWTDPGQRFALATLVPDAE